jgi:hypothetical protein
MKDSAVFSRLMDEYGNLEEQKQTEESRTSQDGVPENSIKHDAKKAAVDLMQDEERNIGAVTWTIYAKYMRFAGGRFWAPLILFLLALSQGAQGDLSFVFYLAFVLIIHYPSCKQSVPWILDGGEYFRVPHRRLHGNLRLSRCSFGYFIIPAQFSICVSFYCVTITTFLLSRISLVSQVW